MLQVDVCPGRSRSLICLIGRTVQSTIATIAAAVAAVVWRAAAAARACSSYASSVSRSAAKELAFRQRLGGIVVVILIGLDLGASTGASGRWTVFLVACAAAPRHLRLQTLKDTVMEQHATTSG